MPLFDAVYPKLDRGGSRPVVDFQIEQIFFSDADGDSGNGPQILGRLAEYSQRDGCLFVIMPEALPVNAMYGHVRARVEREPAVAVDQRDCTIKRSVCETAIRDRQRHNLESLHGVRISNCRATAPSRRQGAAILREGGTDIKTTLQVLNATIGGGDGIENQSPNRNAAVITGPRR